MKKVYLLRHAKSDWDNLALDDYDRPLNARGKHAAGKMGQYMLARGISPQMLLCSSAVRTRETLEYVVAAGVPVGQIDYLDDLYLAPPHRMLEILRETDDAHQTVMMIAHNPGTHDLALRLIGDHKTDGMTNLVRKYPTCSLTEISFQVDSFSKVQQQKGRLLQFVRPKDLDTE